MTKNITIQEGGTPKPMSDVAKIRTSLQGGGTCLWVPEDEVKLTTKHITENGTYKAEDDDKYGYSQVTVNVPGGAGGPAGGPGSSIVGTDPTTGNETGITVGEDGSLTSTDVPSSIRVTTNPTKMDYTDGESIDTTGMVVQAYLADGTLWGTVPAEEVTIDPTTASLDESSPDWTDGDGINAIRIQYVATESTSGSTIYIYPGQLGTDAGGFPATLGGNGPADLLLTRYGGATWVYRVSGNSNFDLYHNPGTSRCDHTSHNNGRWHMTGSTTFHTLEGVWTRTNTFGIYLADIPTSTKEPTGGIGDLYPVGMPVEVMWHRPMDLKELTTSISVSVSPDEGGFGGGGGGGAF
jgi:hypothetical protein